MPAVAPGTAARRSSASASWWPGPPTTPGWCAASSWPTTATSTTSTSCPGASTAYVTGSRREPYRTTLRLTGGGPPTSASQLRFDCTCPDWGNPCKHGVALALALGEELDEDPGLATRFWGTAGSGAEHRAPVRARSVAPAVSLPDAASKPAWAEGLPAPQPATSLDTWFGIPARVPAAGPALQPPNPAVLLELGPLALGPGADLAPALRSLLAHLADT